MSERVEMRMEQSIPEYEQMRVTKIFDNNEINNIIRQREQFEYKLARQQKEVVDYLDYIRYERSLMMLVKGRNYKEHKLINLIVQRIKGLYNQLTKRFPSRKPLWDEYFNFLTSKQSKSDNSEISALLDNMLMHHRHNVEVWLKYIKWERAIQMNEKKVRNLLMRALMDHKNNEDLHIEFIDVELSNHQQVGEQVVLDRVMLLYNNAKLVYNEEKPAERMKSLSFKAAILDKLGKFSFTKEIQLKILDDMQSNKNCETELFWHIMARRELNGQITLDQERNKRLEGNSSAYESERVKIQRCVNVYKGATSKINTVQMWTFYIRTMLELNENVKTLPILKRSMLGCAFKAAFAAKKISELLCLQYLVIMFGTGAADNVISNIIDESLDIYPNSISLWETKMKFYIDHKDEAKVKETFTNAKRKLGNESHSIWSLYLKYLFALNKKDEMKKLFEEIVLQPHANFASLKVDSIDFTATLFGVNEARKFFRDAILAFPCLEMYNKMSEIEELQVKPDVNSWRKCLYLASMNYGADNVDVWLNFVKFELKHGDPKRASGIAEQAVKTLKKEHVDAFIFSRDALQQGMVAP
ncbi:U3 small nucleolar RNA-associated protein 6 like [Pseudolycoriella hygida]|uniref:U3 small nucleolar RNA-associated protein 6 like n=1 Tax=Pseudolycoriella hygida TaxID=35572 RepID=A0A9Q0MYJ8_9DIPT|nr:U3 small nucleolar RNA-associated protein 6 like [Pseudolycoriella hygida]